MGGVQRRAGSKLTDDRDRAAEPHDAAACHPYAQAEQSPATPQRHALVAASERRDCKFGGLKHGRAKHSTRCRAEAHRHEQEHEQEQHKHEQELSKFGGATRTSSQTDWQAGRRKDKAGCGKGTCGSYLYRTIYPDWVMDGQHQPTLEHQPNHPASRPAVRVDDLDTETAARELFFMRCVPLRTL